MNTGVVSGDVRYNNQGRPSGALRSSNPPAPPLRSSRRGLGGFLFSAGRQHRIITILIFLCTFVAYWERLGFSIAFTEIATNMNLSETEKGLVFAAFYYGYSITPIPGGFLAKMYSGKAVLVLAFSLWAPTSSLTALAASDRAHVVAGVVACRVVIGLAQGMFLPAAHSILGHWIPSKHRGRHFAFAMSGMYAGAATAMVVVPTFVSNVGSSSIFHIAAGMAAAWVILWSWAGSSGPPETTLIARRDQAQGEEAECHTSAASTSPAATSSTTTSESSLPSTEVVPIVIVPRSRQASEMMDSAASGGGSADPWSVLGIPAESHGRYFFSNHELYEQVARELGSASTSTTRSNWQSPATSSVRSAFGSTNRDNSETSAVLHGHRLGGRSGAVGAEGPLESSNGDAEKTEEVRSAAGGCRNDRFAFSDDDARIVVADSTPTPASGPSGRHRGSLGSEGGNGRRDDNLRTSTAPSTSSSPRGVPIIRASPSELRYSSSSSTIVQGAERLNQGMMSTTLVDRQQSAGAACGDPRGDPTGGRAGGQGGSSNNMDDTDRGGGGCDASRHNRAVDNRPQCARAATMVLASAEIDAGHPTTAIRAEYNDPRLPQGKRGTMAPAPGWGERERVAERRAFGQCTASSSSGSGRSVSGLTSSCPWRAMCCSPAAWATVAGNVGCSTGVSVMMSWQPTYFKDLLGIDLEHLGLVDQLSPYLTMLVFSILGGMWYTWLVCKREMSKSVASKLITGVGLSLALAAFLAMRLATTAAAGTLVTSAALAALALSRGGWSTNHAEICSPENGAILFSVANCISSATSVVGISVTGNLLDAFGGASSPGAWTAAMGMVGGVCGVCGALYVVAGGGDEVLFPSWTSPSGGESRTGGEGVRQQIACRRADEVPYMTGVTVFRGGDYREDAV